jgi:hypothetical protein
MQIRIKPQVVGWSDGFDFFGRPNNSNTVEERKAQMQYDHMRSIHSGANNQKGIFVYWKEKHRASTKVETLLTKSGKPSKKTKVTKIPTHWKYKIWFIPDTIVQLLKADGKVIKQSKDHWSIIDTRK